MADEELNLLQREGIRINRDKNIRENLANELKEFLTEDEYAHVYAGQMPVITAISLVTLRLYMRGRK